MASPSGTSAVSRVCAAGLRLGFVLAALAAAYPAAAQVTPGAVIQTIDTSLWSPPSTDPSGITYRPDTGELITSDAEVEESAGGITFYQGVNVWTHTRTGEVTHTATTMTWSREPTGICFDPAGDRLFIADDVRRSVYEVALGADAALGGGDDVRMRLRGYDTAGCDDIEDVTYDSFASRLYVASGSSQEICRISPGPNGVFDGGPGYGDDVVETFSVAAFGLDPEGIVYDPYWNTLVVADRGTRDLYELTPEGGLLRRIDVDFPTDIKPSGVTIAPGSTNPMLRNYFVSDRHVDNDTDPNSNDGRIFEVVALPLGGNGAPIVDAGPAQTLVWPSNNVTLDGFASDDGHPWPASTLALLWVEQSGPGSVSFADPNQATTNASFSEPGVYVLQLVANDTELVSLDTVTITVDATVTVAVSSSGPGEIVLDPPGGTYTYGDAVTVQAAPEPGAAFLGFSGDLAGTASPQLLVLDGDKSVSADFEPRYALDVVVSGAGTVTLDPPGGSYPLGTAVTLTAIPQSGWYFSGWSGATSGAANPLGLVVDGDTAVTAQFNDAGSPGVSCGIGPELALLLPALAWLRRRRRTARP
jgi:hypothetical protein